ncbi:hypothetical protein, partial [Streptomyces sp. NPDC003015]
MRTPRGRRRISRARQSSGTATGVRHCTAPGGAMIVRTGTGTNYGFELAADQHGTNTRYLDNTAQTPTWRPFDPRQRRPGGGDDGPPPAARRR